MALTKKDKIREILTNCKIRKQLNAAFVAVCLAQPHLGKMPEDKHIEFIEFVAKNKNIQKLLVGLVNMLVNKLEEELDDSDVDPLWVTSCTRGFKQFIKSNFEFASVVPGIINEKVDKGEGLSIRTDLAMFLTSAIGG